MRDDLLPGPGRRAPGKPARKKWGRKLLLAALALGAAWMIGGWAYDAFFKSPEDRIREALQAAAQGARERNPAHVTAILSEDFQGPMGAGKMDVHRAMIRLLMREFRRIELDLTPVPIPVQLDPQDPKRAKVTFHAHVRGKFTEESKWVAINPRAGGTLFKAAFKRTDQGWKMDRLAIEKE